ncbi:hypothetical protein BP5796_11384 [Coleophoma crateriformis]|uniref:Metallo-beta-lactamase domain-containing protein n=1 Tax=Coleophoma crateriformis TaxID=565419 RepID=A0A3D8QI26_9HELO|nr:hypothetical protein BP5796_11384 [Coleophoma crateriformis]
MAPQPPPDLQIPLSTSTVHVQIINTTAHITDFPMSLMVYPVVKGHESLSAPVYSFLITHPSSNRKVVFDLGVRPDWQNLAPRVVRSVSQWTVKAEKGVKEILENEDIKTDEIEAVVWSHHHWDHVGDVSTFSKKTKLIVGPGFKKEFLPGYPANAESLILESDYEGREVEELSFSDSPLKIGRFPAIDYFADGSFYLLDAPGHTVGHICGLARVSSQPDSYVFMGADSCHHGGEFRPSQYLPFPESISPHPLLQNSTAPCPGAMFSHLLRDNDFEKPFYSIRKPDGTAPGAVDADVAEQTIEKVQEVDVDERILVVMAHDESLLEIVDFFPAYADDFVKKDWVKKARWAFLKDFGGATSS